MQSRQAQLTGIVREHDKQLQANAEADAARDRAIVEQMEKGGARDRRIAVQEMQIKEHHRAMSAQMKMSEALERRLEENGRIDRKQDEVLKFQRQKDEKHDKLLDEVERAIRKQDMLIQAQAESITELQDQSAVLKKQVNQKVNQVLLYVTAGVSAVALILSIIHFFI